MILIGLEQYLSPSKFKGPGLGSNSERLNVCHKAVWSIVRHNDGHSRLPVSADV